MTSTRVLLAGGLIAATVATTASAGTVAYYRFEAGGFLADSSGNANTLTNLESTAQVALPATGNASDFPSIIPQTGATNGSVADFTGTSGVSGFSASDSASFGTIATNGKVSVEAFINSGTPGASPEDARYIAGQYKSSTGERSWALQVNGSNGLTALLGDGGTFWESPDTDDNVIEDNKDYYVGFTFDVATDDAIFYWQNLTDGGELQSQTIALSVDATSLGNVGLDVGIGNNVAGSTKRWTANGGFIDEVRISNEVLSETELLVSVPEPGSLALLGVGGLMMIRRRQRRG